MKQIYTHDNIVDLQSAKIILALNDIESFVENERTIPSGARHGIENTFLALWTSNDQDIAKASEIIETQLTNPEPIKAWACATCDKENDRSFDFCWQCQAEK